jgi:alpha-1,6-mannosyltransferase
MAAGLALAIEDRPLAGVGLCAVAATIKLPAAAAIVFIVVAAARGADTRAGRARLLSAAALLTAAVLVLISVATGVGAHWLSTGVFSTPQKVRLAITPATGIGYTLASVLHHLGIAANARSIESAFGDLAGVLVVVLAAMLLWRVSKATLVRDLGIVLVAAAVGGPAAWPWYLIWGLALLAACPGPQRSRAFPFALTVPVFLIKADGIALPPRPYSPLVVAVYAAIAAVAWQTWRRSGGALPRLERHPGRPSPEPTT